MDWREPNRCLDTVHQEVPTFDQLRHNLNGARVFSKLDLSSAFFQFKLDHESSRLTTFVTPWGLKRSTRLVQGAKPSAAICHKIIRRTLQGISHALNIYDDILVWGCGSTQEEAQKDHDFNLRQVFEVFRLKGLTINKEKCEFSATKIKFFSFMVSEDGFGPDPDKAKDLREADESMTKEVFFPWNGGVQLPLYSRLCHALGPASKTYSQECRISLGPRGKGVLPRHL